MEDEEDFVIVCVPKVRGFSIWDYRVSLEIPWGDIWGDIWDVVSALGEIDLMDIANP